MYNIIHLKAKKEVPVLAESIITSITSGLTKFIPAEIIIFIVSLLPVLELRGGLIAASLLKVNWVYAFLICIVGNLLPIPIILLFIDKIFAVLKKTKLKKTIEHFEKRATAKSSSVTKHRKLGLFLFVAIPLPGTGAWTAALIASILRMKIKEAFLPIIFGVLAAGLIMSFVSYVVPYFLYNF